MFRVLVCVMMVSGLLGLFSCQNDKDKPPPPPEPESPIMPGQSGYLWNPSGGQIVASPTADSFGAYLDARDSGNQKEVDRLAKQSKIFTLPTNTKFNLVGGVSYVQIEVLSGKLKSTKVWTSPDNLHRQSVSYSAFVFAALTLLLVYGVT